MAISVIFATNLNMYRNYKIFIENIYIVKNLAHINNVKHITSIKDV